MDEFAACTIVAHNYLPQARILADSFKIHHPESTFYIVVVDRPLEARLIRDGNYQVIPITDINFGDEGFEYMATIYDVTEFATSVKPFALSYLLQNHECVFYIDPDIKVFAPLTPLVEKTREIGWSLTPHSVKPIIRNGWQPTEEEIKGAGIYNLGYIGVTRKRLDMLNWWETRLRRDCIIDVPRQLFTDQRWVDMAVAMYPTYIERGSSYNVAYWNLDQRTLWKDGDTYKVDDDVLRFFHFSGYDPNEPHWISKYQIGRPRVLISENTVLAELCEQYGKQMLAIRNEIADSAGYGWKHALPGLVLTKSMRRFFRDELIRAEADDQALPPSPFVVGGSSRYLLWLKSIQEDDTTKLPRLLSGVYRGRGDLQQHFPEVLVGDAERLLNWVKQSGRREVEAIRLIEIPNSAVESPSLIVEDVASQPGGVDVLGYLNAELGVGEAGRLVVTSFKAADVPVSTISYQKTVSRQQHPFSADNAALYDVLFMAVNADQVESTTRDLGRAFLKNRYVIGQWFWELEELPDRYMRSFDFVDEIWAPTKFIYNSIVSRAPKTVQVKHVHLPLVKPDIDLSFSREDIGVDDKFMFLFTFDFMSVLKRKNAIGVIDAYRRAFLPGGGAVLVVKTINGDKRLNELERLRWHARDRSDIVIIDQYFDSACSAALIGCCDAYVSLHRSEGLGLTMAEAMLMGKPVIATAYSGNMDFMTPENSCLVPWKSAKVGKDAEGYPPTSRWAEPSLEAAVGYMRRLFEDRSFATEIGENAERDLLERFSPVVTGRKMKQRLEEIWKGHHEK
jgi:glycosyltransferase involved in cell wall biosynthesis